MEIERILLAYTNIIHQKNIVIKKANYEKAAELRVQERSVIDLLSLKLNIDKFSYNDISKLLDILVLEKFGKKINDMDIVDIDQFLRDRKLNQLGIL